MTDFSIAYDFYRDSLVQANFGKENQGFLLARSGAIDNQEKWAHYVDGVKEQINPIEGYPRPDPDPAVRTKRVSVPPSLRTGLDATYKHASRYSGQMRRVVQCFYSRGVESKFSYTWAKTHGILEYPYPHQSGATVGEEVENAKVRRYWLIEISSQGVYAAPINIGTECLHCANNILQYQPTTLQLVAHPEWEPYTTEISLAWAYANANNDDKTLIQQLLDSNGIHPAYASPWTTWYGGMGWAFSASGYNAANVVNRMVYDGNDFGGNPDYYQTRIVELDFSVSFSQTQQVISVDVISPQEGQTPAVVRVLTNGSNDFKVGDLAILSGADQGDYNGPHLVKAINDLAHTFDFWLPFTPATSPATGNIEVANSSSNATLAANLTIGSSGRVTFRRSNLGTLWVPDESAEDIHQWEGVFPFWNIIADSGPVHVFYDGEQQVLTSWGLTSTPHAAESNLDGSTPFPDPDFFGHSPPQPPYPGLWDGTNSSGTHVSNMGEHNAVYIGPICQQWWGANISIDGHLCANKSLPVWYGNGHSTGGYTELNWGFTGPFAAEVTAYNRNHITSASAPVGDPWVYSEIWYNDRYYACSACGGDGVTRFGITTQNQTLATDLDKTVVSSQQTASGESVCILFPTDREAVAGIKIQNTGSSDQTTITHFYHIIKTKQIVHNATGPYTSPVEAWAVAPISIRKTIPGTATLVPQDKSSSSSSNSTSNFFLRASGGINEQRVDVAGFDDITPFLTWVAGSQETAQSSLFFMRGGLNYPDPNLSPSDQKANHVIRVLGEYAFGGNFGPLGPTGPFDSTPNKTPEAFIGRV